MAQRRNAKGQFIGKRKSRKGRKKASRKTVRKAPRKSPRRLVRHTPKGTHTFVPKHR